MFILFNTRTTNQRILSGHDQLNKKQLLSANENKLGFLSQAELNSKRRVQQLWGCSAANTVRRLNSFGVVERGNTCSCEEMVSARSPLVSLLLQCKFLCCCCC